MRISDWRSDVCSSDLGPFCCGNRVGDGLMRRVVVTGLGLVTPLGSDVETVWGNILASKSGAGTIERFDPTDYACRLTCDVNPGDGRGVPFDARQRVDNKIQRHVEPFIVYGLDAD